MAQDLQTYRRAANAAMFGLIVQAVVTTVMALAGLAIQSPPLYAATWHMAGGMLIWIILLMLFHQHRLELTERLETEQLAKPDALFNNEAAEDLYVARRRLNTIYRVGLGIVGVFTSAYLLIAGGVFLYKAVEEYQQGTLIAAAMNDVSPIAASIACLAVMFVAFIVGRYEAGMTRISEYQALRGGAGYIMGNAVVALLLAIALGCAAFDKPLPLAMMSLVVPSVMVLLGVEILLNFLFNLYRPRRPGEFQRPAFDSRLLGLLTSPKSIAKALSDAINYQFGFEVSSSWFYQLLGRAVTPLFIFGLLVLMGTTCIVIVQPHEQAIILNGGEISGTAVGPGLHLKRPWPLSSVEIYEVTRVQKISIGSAAEGFREDVALLWTNPHAKGGEQYLITAPTVHVSEQGTNSTETARAPDASLVGLQMNIQYRIRDLIEYVKYQEDPGYQLASIAERALTQYLVTRDIDRIIGKDRINAGDELRAALQTASIDAKLGLEIVLVTLEGVHPPSEKDVAASFHTQIAALQQNQSEIERARGDATRTLAEVTGSPENAVKLIAAIRALTAAEQSRDAQRVSTPQDQAAIKQRELAVTDLEQQVDSLLAEARGQAAGLIYSARSHRWELAVAASANADKFSAQLSAYANAPEYYRMRQYFQVLAEGMAKSRKIVTTADNLEAPTFDLDLTDAQSAVETIMKPK